MSFSLQLKVKIYVINVNFVAKFGCCIDLLNQMVNILCSSDVDVLFCHDRK